MPEPTSSEPGAWDYRAWLEEFFVRQLHEVVAGLVDLEWSPERLQSELRLILRARQDPQVQRECLRAYTRIQGHLRRLMDAPPPS